MQSRPEYSASRT